jgi:4-hydroxy-tetrahydrodipicolinate synthase
MHSMDTYHGIYTPLVTPIDERESPDLASLRQLVEFQIESGVHGLWAMGTTSEFASFDLDERKAVVQTTVEAAGGRVPVIANISDASTRLAIRHGHNAREVGANAIAATPPYYFPHSQDEVVAHFRAIRDAVDLPLFIYNIPQTVRVRVELPTSQALALEGVAVGIKDSQNDFEALRALSVFVRRNTLDFAVFAGTRFLIDAAVMVGACGAIPSIANAFPDLCVAVYDAAMRGDFATSTRLQERIIAIESATGAVALGSRNAAVLGLQKAMLVHRGVIAGSSVTLPLRTLEPGEHERLLASILEGETASVVR